MDQYSGVSIFKMERYFLLKCCTYNGWSWILAREEIGNAQDSLSILYFNENLESPIEYLLGLPQSNRISGTGKHYNIYGNYLNKSAPFAGIYRLIQLENNVLLQRAESITYFTKNCLGECKHCRIDKIGCIPTKIENDLRGTCFEEYGDQKILNLDFSKNKNDLIIYSAKRNLQSDFESENKLFYLGPDSKNSSQMPKKIGFQGYYFNGEQYITSVDEIQLTSSFTIETWFKLTELYPDNRQDIDQRYSIIKLIQTSGTNQNLKLNPQSSPYFSVSFINSRNEKL
ncbi:UNKNOWN [Stylonychia lemnae]|uniref:Uncharacterized protein n=1 Tax=Stylonychia lemnae TaxID=5949 RepID=A0A078B3L4_STYLE|nr:UNKNOWN [Stylonychia lemnae]|eukprot:CDW89044.1 UNKNOWN [Stylonychia lemnae]